MSNNVVNNNNSNNSNNSTQTGYASDNFFDGCPALMSDGRFITNYKPNCEMNRRIESTFNKGTPMSSWEYKYHLTNDTEKVLDVVNNNNNKMYGCTAHPYNVPGPAIKQDCNYDNCIIKSTNNNNNNNNNNGIGLY